MSRDNVTPFRRRPPPKRSSGGLGLATHRGKAVFVHVLTLACFVAPFALGFVPLGSLIGLAFGIGAGLIAYANRAEAMPWAATHHEHALRTLIIAFALTTLISLPNLVIPRDTMANIIGVYGPIVFWANIVVLIWAVIRAGVGLVLAILRKPIWHPRGWLL